MTARLVLKAKTIVDDALDLTGADVEACTVDGCVLTLEKAEGLRLVRNHLKDCQLAGDGWEEIGLVRRPQA